MFETISKTLQAQLPSLTTEAEIAVYMVHNSLDPEDYFFLFDFEAFVEQSGRGVFVQPKLTMSAGRDDFSRTVFARQLRQVFAQEFDAMRARLADGKSKGRGWLDWNFVGNSAAEMLGGFVANLVLAAATSAGRSILSALPLPKLWSAKTDEARLEDEIAKTKSQVEDALANMSITLHPELYEHAYPEGTHGKRADLDRDAWPLPAYVRTHLSTGQSGSWW